MKACRLLPVALSLLLAACGGSDPSASRFAGVFNGTFLGQDVSGTSLVVISDDGTITGTSTDSRYGNNGVLTGSRVQGNGHIKLVATYPQGAGAVPIAVTTEGTITPDGLDLHGTLQEQQGDDDASYRLHAQALDRLGFV